MALKEREFTPESGTVDTYGIRVPNLFPIGTAVWHVSHIFECLIPNPLQITNGYGEVNLFSRCPFPDESASCVNFGCDRSSGLRQDVGDCQY